MNEHRREDALFNCLKIPADEVKLAVVNCLFVVPQDELDKNEIEQIINIMSTCNNISAGETELVLSTVYWICNKFVELPDDGTFADSSIIFQKDYGE